MNRLIRRTRQSALLLSTVLGCIVFSGCAPQAMMSESTGSAPAPENRVSQGVAAPAGGAPAEGAATDAIATNVASAPAVAPQLVKTAELVITVDSVEQTLVQITAIARQQQGDILNLNDQTPPDDYSRHTATVQLRIPQLKLDATLDALGNLGTVQRQSLAAEDVSTQLVDLNARLRNLRRTEEMLLDIMKRSGDMGDVLKVSQELSNVRSSIEQIDAQFTALKNRVAYSVVNLSLQEAIVATPPQTAVSTQLQNTWDGATHSIGKVTVDLLQLGIWLLVYSPYWLAIALAAYYIRRRWGRGAAHGPAAAHAETSGTTEA
ncbi:MAG TPA: DUF4349 domain-containing protein [Chroococcidiopsis sp.]